MGRPMSIIPFDPTRERTRRPLPEPKQLQEWIRKAIKNHDWADLLACGAILAIALMQKQRGCGHRCSKCEREAKRRSE